MKTINQILFFLLILINCTGCNSLNKYKTFKDFRSNYSSKLTYIGPSPQEWENEEPPDNITEIFYESNGTKLKGWYSKPKTENTQLIPAVVYVHGGFAFGGADFYDALPFLGNGFAVLTPTLRGENGNKGNYELMLGEVDDVISAVKWLSLQNGIDKNNIYVFGHSVGGGISALVSLYDEPLIKMTGSSGGLYSEKVFYDWKDFTPFNYLDKKEQSLRILLTNTHYMKKQHISYIGKDDILVRNVKIATNEILKTKAPLEVVIIPGDHYSSLNMAIEKYIEKIKDVSENK